MGVFFPGLSEVEQAFDLSFVDFDDDEVTEIGPLMITPREVTHPSGAPPFALRVTVDGRSIAYSGDTEWTDALVDVARSTDLFLCEAYFYEKQVPYHLSYGRLKAERERLDADRIVVTHMSEDMLARRDEIDLETATDGAQFEIR